MAFCAERTWWVVSVDIIVNGACGRMGRIIAFVVLNDSTVRLRAAVDIAANPDCGKDIGLLCGLNPCGVMVNAGFEGVDVNGAVVIDFTAPKATLETLELLKGRGCAFVIGTTGLTDSQRELVAQHATTTPVVMSPNMSLGVNLLFHLTALAAKRLGMHFDIEIVEAHHHHKKDAPSGTAQRLGEIAADAIDQVYEESVCHGRAGIVGERTRGEIGMHAVRGGDIIGDHTVLFAGPGERLELKHMAHSRSTFAQGAVRAAQWVAPQAPGLYSMQDVLSI
jgi:4-hydroxy-tetrahydrodipicolinate reductase